MATPVRPSRADDDEALSVLARKTWSSSVSPGNRPARTAPFFTAGIDPSQVLVAGTDGTLVGYVRLAQSLPIPSHAHVLEISGLAVDAGWRRQGIGRRLVEAAVDRARALGARKVSLRVLSSNEVARRLYFSIGFVEEGVLRAEFVIEGQRIDDRLLALHL